MVVQKAAAAVLVTVLELALEAEVDDLGTGGQGQKLQLRAPVQAGEVGLPAPRREENRKAGAEQIEAPLLVAPVQGAAAVN